MKNGQRLCDKIVRSLRPNERVGTHSNVGEMLCADEGTCNVIPGRARSQAYEVIIVYSHRKLASMQGGKYLSAHTCLRRLSRYLRNRVHSREPTRMIKVVLDRFDPEISMSLVEVLRLAHELGAEIQVDLFVDENIEPICLEKLLRRGG